MKVAAQRRNLAVGASDPVELFSTLSSDRSFMLELRMAHTVREALEMAAEEIDLPKVAAQWLLMKFDKSVVEHRKTLKQAGLYNQAEFFLLGEDQARTECKNLADQVNIFEATWNGKLDEVLLVCLCAPEKVNFKDEPVTALVLPRYY